MDRLVTACSRVIISKIGCKNIGTRLVASGPAWLTSERGMTTIKPFTKLTNGLKIDKNGLAWKGRLSGGAEEFYDVLLSGAVVDVAVCDMATNPSFVHR
jgi:hypothetical protein